MFCGRPHAAVMEYQALNSISLVPDGRALRPGCSVTRRKTMTSKAKLVLISAIAAVILASPALALTQQVSHLICPSGYSLIGEYCISDKIGDIVLPATYK